MARKDFMQRDWWTAAEGQSFLEVGFAAFLDFCDAEKIRCRQLPGVAHAHYSREDIENAVGKYVTTGARRITREHRRNRAVKQPSTV